MERTTTLSCEDNCKGTEADLDAVRGAMLDGESIREMADWFKALGDPTRVRIIDALTHGELCVHDLSVLLDMGQSAVSHQLRYLRDVRMVKRRKAGKTVYYSLDDDHIGQVFQVTHAHVKHK
ncbi:ArsR/SmtB family transcription factor [Cohnella sp. JJ-181]|uniref:ArsR/SmtB family transcription factor n=1 Tax=Cohnella rhizoplanae TaxID=2974897 RepID=UPI0022FF751E|nr:metalloregulator ArsR/SmtB family transcription factor [Cohnella sp. JJ-181]CAI6031203.1 Transcriptional repressor SmtB [Cohnella sp. JJ-181]